MTALLSAPPTALAFMPLDLLTADFLVPMGAAAEIERLAALIDDGICTVEESRITVTGKGRPYVRLVAAAFDAYPTTGGPRHSSAV